MSKKAENPLSLVAIQFVITAVVAMILWPLMDLFWCNVITHSDFSYNFGEYIGGPIIFAFVITIVFNWKTLFGKKKQK